MSLIAHYKLNDNAANTTVVASVGVDGTLIGGDNTSVLSESGKISRALHLDGSADYVDISASPLDKTFASAQGSICCWAKNDSSTPAGYQYIIGRNAAGVNTGNIAIYLNDTTNKIGGFVEDTTTTHSAPANNALADTNWHHYILTWNSTEVAFYVDGVKQSSPGTGTELSADASLGFAIGSRSDAGATQCWDGLIDDVRFYDHVLSTFERNFIYNSGNGTEDEVYDTLSVSEGLSLNDEISSFTNPETLEILEDMSLRDEIITQLPWITTYYATTILSYNPLIYVTDTNPATIVVVDITVPESPVNTVYTLTGVSNANSVSYNSTNGYVYAVTDNGKVVKIDTTNFASQTIIDTLDTDNLMLSAVVSPELKLFSGTDDVSGEVILIDEAEFKNINLDIRFLQEWKRNLNLKINTILAKAVNTDIRYIAEQTAKIGLDIRFLKYDYSVASQYPLSYLDWKVYINNVQMDTINDIDMKSITINHNIENKSTASFILHRQHDKLDFTNTGVASQITNQNEVKIYINNILEFDGKISNYNCSLEGEQVSITALMDTPTDDRSLVNIPLPSVNETLNLYHCLNDNISIENPYQDTRAVIIGDDGKYWAAGIWVYKISDALVFGSDSEAEAYINATTSAIFTNKNPSVASRESSVQYYKGVKINLGTSIVEKVKRYTTFTDVADAILDGTFNQQQNWDYFWKVSLRDFTQGIVEKPGFGESSFTDARYIGTSISPITSDTYILDSAYYSYQRIYDDIETELGYYYLGSAPFLEVSCSNGKKTVAERWEDRSDGLYRVINDSYNYVDYCKAFAANEYSKLLNINGDVLPITQANLTLTLNGYYYYGIKLLKRINLVNTTTANIYKNLNGFPVAVKSISISSNDMKVILNCDNQKVQIELDEIDETLPDIENYQKSGTAKKIHSKYDPLARQWIV